jgi:amino acid adenylation domain-containing protein
MRTSNEREIRSSDIAVIGMNCRVPGAKSPEEFWENLKAGKESIVFFDDKELRAAGVPQETLDDPHYVKARATLDNIDLFDAAFFGFSPREAESLDPQHRLFLECAWELLESAGHGAPGAEELIGVYAGIGTNNYVAGVLSHDGLAESLGRFSISMANDKDFLATNVSYKLNLKGPSVTVQTACSTSLVAVHAACQSIFSGGCDMALAGGVSLDVPQKSGYPHKEGDILSPDGHCRAFDAKAQGTVPGSGVGVVLLKRLEDALADGDYVHAVIRGSAINNDGSAKVGYTAPSIEGQARIIRAAQALAEVEAESISYVEAHGTGTSIGDPIEIAALTEAFRSSTEKKRFCAIGSVKTNLGHLNTAAGVVGLIKTILSLEHRQIPPSLHFDAPNPKIDFDGSPVYVNTKLQDWTGPLPLRAGVSSFGMGGTNAHVVLEEAPERSLSSESRPSLLVLSAKTAGALKNAGINLAGHLKKHEDACLADVAYTLQTGRKGFAHRQAIVCEDREQAIRALEGIDPEFVRNGVAPQSEPGVVFMFPGQGSQFIGMGRQLYESESAFRKIVDECSERLKPVLGLDLRHIMYPAEDQRENAAEQLRQTGITQPAMFVIEYALARLWMKWGVRPQAMIGHSLGEYVAATIAGVITEEDALNLVAARAQLMQKMPRGSMLAVELSVEELLSRLNADLCLAGINGPRQTVVSGPSFAIDALEKQLTSEGIVCRQLQTSHAFHSHMMDPMLAHFFREVSKVKLRSPSIPYLSNLTGTWIAPAEAADPEYWVKHLREAVRFGPGIQEIMKTPGERVLLEVGPGQALSGLARKVLDAQAGARLVSSLLPPKKDQSEQAFLVDALGKLWLAGVTVNWRAVHAGEKRYRVPLPAYPFERQRYWVDPLPHVNGAGRKQASSGKKADIGDWFYLPFWKPSVLGQSSRKPGAKQNWLVFGGEEGLGLDLARELAAAGENVVTVQAGERFLELDENTYSLRPQQQADYEELLATLHEQKRWPRRIVHLWNVNAETTAPGYWRFSNQSQYSGFYSLLFLAKTLHKQAAMEPVEIVVVSNNVQTVTGQEHASPEKATLLGPCLAIPYEYPSVSCRSVDFMPAPSGTWQGERVLKQLMAELAAESTDPMIAYRGQTRWLKKFEPARLEKKEGRPPRLREKGVYLITGGLGQIGLELGEYLARSVRARLVLVGASAFPAQEQWDDWLASHDDQDEVCRKIRKLQSVRGLGSEILIAQADTGNLQQMQKIVNAARERFGPIQGVIHAAGRVRSMRLMQETEPADCDLHFQSKARGLLVLEQVLRQEPLGFCVLFSSLASILGGAGYCAYSAANFFMDSLTQCRQHHSALAWTSVNWDGWSFTHDNAGAPAPGSSASLLSMTPSQGVEAFHRILWLDPVAQVLVSTGDLDVRFKQLVHGPQSEHPELKRDSAAESLHSRPALGTAYVAPASETEIRISKIWQELLGIGQIGIHDNFFEMGGNSVMATQLLSRLRQVFMLAIPLETVFDNATIGQLAKALTVYKRAATAREHTPAAPVIAEPVIRWEGAAKEKIPSPLVRRARPERLPLSFTLVPRERPLRLPLSHAQQRLWFITQLEENSTQYNIPEVLRLHGELDCEALERAINAIVARHEILRTRFTEVDGEPVQIIETELQIALAMEDCSALNEAAQEEKIAEAARKELAQSFNLTTGPLLRIKLLKLGDHEYVLFRTFHHIVSDGWSHGIFTRELMVLYEAFREGRGNTLEPLPLQYADFALWQREFLDEEAVERELEYWKEKLKGIPEQLALAHDRPRPPRQTFAAELSQTTVSAETVAALRHLGQERQATLYMTLLAVFALLLRRYSGQDDIVVGSPVANRQDSRLEQLIGLFVNSLVMRTQIHKEETFLEFLAGVRRSALEAYLHQDVPFEKLVEELSPQRSLNVTPIFQVLFAMQNAPVSIHRLQNLAFEPVRGGHSTVRTDLEVHAYEHSGQITFYWLYKRDLFDRWRIEQMSRHYVRMLELVLANPDWPVHQFDPLTAAEKHQILVEWNSKSAPCGPERTIAQLFQQHVLRAPDAPALTFAGQSMTYDELHGRSNQLGNYLNELGVGPEVRVGACFERGPEMVIALLAIMKAGGTYVPLDPDFPADRLTYMAQDAACRVVLAEGKSRTTLPKEVQVVAMDENQEKIACASTNTPPYSAGPNNAAYVIYTSGSTGRPKGVVIEHRNVLHMVHAQREAFGVRETDAVLQFFSFSFDVSVFATLMALCAGARLVLGSREELLPGPGLLRLLESEEVTVGVLPPVVLDHLPEARLPKLRQIIVGGEPWSEDLLKTWGKGRRFFNSYGPTETTVQATVGECHAGEGKPSIGHPILNARIYLLDDERKPVPTGVAGELYIGGNGVGRGYLDHALTAERFVRDPFSEQADARMYRTGDWALWLPDGRINLLGRKDEQVKIRGHRVELGEIESVLSQHPAVLQSAVLVRKSDGHEARLVAYVVPNPGQTAATAVLRSHLKKKLPDYMVPAQFVLLPELPLNSSGKVDRHALPDVEAGAGEGRAPRTPEEEVLCQIFAEVLGLERVSIDDNFFDSGGHSLMATRLASRVRSMLGVELPLRTLFESPTVAGLRPHLRQAEKARAPLTAESRPERLPMSYAQQRLWFFDQLQGKSAEYNVPEALRLRGEVDYSALERALWAIVQRHEILRTRFAEAEDGQPVQIVDPESRVFLQIEDLSGLDEGSRQRQITAAKKNEQEQPFDLARGPLLRMKLFKLDEHDHILLRTFHHIVTDGWSQATFNREFMLLYDAFHQNQADPLQPLSVQYADFALWQRKWLDATLTDQLAYWKHQLAGIPEELALPKDRPRPPRQTFDAGACQISLSPEQTAALKRLSNGSQATLFMTLLALFATLLQRYSGQDDIVLGSPIANRQEEQLEQLVGFFVNSLVLRVRVNPAQTFSELLSGVRKMALDAYRHQDLPFERLVEELSPQRSLNKTPLYQILFLLQNAPMQAPALQGLEMEHLPGEGLHTHFDMELQAMERGNTMGLFWVYNRDLFDRWRIEQMARHYKRLVDAAIAEPNLPLCRLEMLEEAEKQQILLEWNSTQREYAAADALHMTFETQAARTPEAPAVVCGSESLSYRDLNERANRLARYLTRLGVGPENRVGVCLERGMETIEALLAVLKAGAAYVPLDPKYPAERLSYMLEDSQTKVLLTETRLLKHLPPFAGTLVEMDSQCAEIAAMSSENPGINLASDNLAYVIYTSGSTGKPKGVAISHSSVVTFLHWCRETFLPEELSRVLASTSICFDLSVFEIFAPLSCGGSTVVVSNALELAEAAKAAGVTLVNTVPSAMRELVRMKCIPESVRVINLAGEALTGALVREIYHATKAEKVFNLYGPSEDTTYSTFACVPRSHQGAAAPIGKPIANSQVYVLDDWMHVVPVGVAGQLYVAGAGLARGYLNRPGLTAESFIPDPFGTSAGGRLYRTGDLVKWSADGNLEFLGRADHQVKIRGFRIELGEIEAALQQHAEVEHAVVLAREDGSGEKRLTAYVVASGRQEESAKTLREYLKGKLPDHMSPAYYVFLDRLPLTENGKVDRKALSNPEQPAAAVYVAPRTAIQQLIAKIWQEALLIERVGLDDNFFDLGGHSLLVARVRFTLREKLGRDVALMDFFTYPTIRTLAQRLDEAAEANPVNIFDSQLRAARQKAGVLRHRQIALKAKIAKEPA